MHSLTAIIVAASIFSNISSFKNNPVEYHENLYSKVNENIAVLLQVEQVEEGGKEQNIASGTDFISQVLGEQESTEEDQIEPSPTAEPTITPLSASPIPSLEPAATTTPSPMPTETPEPSPTVPKFDNSDQVGAVERAANEFGVDMNLMKRIASCETGFNAYARNTGPNHDYGGLFQFSVGTWISTRTRMGADTNPELRFSAQEAARTAAFKIKHDGPSAWSGCL